MAVMSLEGVILEGRQVRLEPLSQRHHAQLCAVGLDENIWRWNPFCVLRTPADMEAYVATALRQQAEGTVLAFATVYKNAAHAVGSTRFSNFDAVNRHVEIGSTWIAPPWQRTAVNTEAKYLMLRHAFEVLGCIRVEFKTDSLNERSRKAIQRIGAQQEGILRNHMVTHTGRFRHSVYFSILDAEWPAVKARLEGMLNSAGTVSGAAARPPAA